MTTLTQAEAVPFYVAQSWVPIPIVARAKRAAVAGWQKRTVADVKLEEFAGRNVGIVLGEPSGNLVDVDLDCPEAVIAAEYLLPPTGMIHGRPGSPASHRWYVVDVAPSTARHKDDLGVLVELRGTGGQTVVPPSIHPSGEQLTWSQWPPEPAHVTLLALSRAVEDVAAAAALARHHPGDGSRHDFALLVAGCLAHLGYPEERAQLLVQAVSAAAGDADPKDRAAGVTATYKRFREGGEVSGTPKLAEVVPNVVVDHLREWLSGRSEVPAAIVVTPDEGGTLADRLGTYARFLQFGGKGKLINSAANAALILARDREFGAPPPDEFGAAPLPGPALGFDEMGQQELWRRPPPEGTGFATPTGVVADHHLLYVQAWLYRLTRVEFKTMTIIAAVQAAAHECTYNPVTEYLEGLSWDGTPRLSEWLITYLGAAPSAINRRIARWWLISAVARAFRPGCRADHMLVLEGPQGAKKSTALQVLADRWYSPGPEKLGDKDGPQSLRGRWIIEMAELDALKGRELATIKKFLTDPSDVYRPSYGRYHVTVARRCVFAGTTNEATYLHDVTGGRRFWPVLVGKIDIDGLTRDRDQLFAEAVVAFEAGEPWWPSTEDEHAELRELQDERHETDAWTDTILDYLDGRTEVPALKGSAPVVTPVRSQVTVDEILVKVVALERGRYGRVEQMRVGNILRRLGWCRARVTVRGRQSWVYKRPVTERAVV